MTTIDVNASKFYQVQIGNDILHTLGQQVAAFGKVSKVCLISETTVWPLYGNAAEKSLKDAGLETCHFVFPAGEQSKNGQIFLEILNFLAENHLTRTDAIVALGGGVVGDLAGFCAASFLRGIRFVQVPTTLLAAVDSSVGGKTAIDLPAGKNLAGAFCQPSLVLCDLKCLESLPDDIFLDGCAEIIKTAILFDPSMFEQLLKDGPEFHRESIIAQCVSHKRDIVNADEFEHGQRQKLNLGHTIGHGVEAMSSFTLSHGKSVSIGTAIVARASAHLGLCSPETSQRCLQILTRFKLPIHTEYCASDLCRMALSDKKRSGETVNLIIPKEIGECVIRPTPVNEIESFIQAGL